MLNAVIIGKATMIAITTVIIKTINDYSKINDHSKNIYMYNIKTMIIE